MSYRSVALISFTQLTSLFLQSYELNGVTLSCDGGKCVACVCDGVIASSKPCATEKIYDLPYFFLLVSLFWTCGVCANAIHCTVAASVSQWWGNPNIPHNKVVWDSFRRSLTESFGSICFGSLFIAVIKSTRTVLYVLKYQFKKINTTSSFLGSFQSMLLSILSHLLRLVDGAMEYFNLYAFCFVAIYGYPFIKSSR